MVHLKSHLMKHCISVLVKKVIGVFNLEQQPLVEEQNVEALGHLSLLMEAELPIFVVLKMI